jgi:hypothetical protein
MDGNDLERLPIAGSNKGGFMAKIIEFYVPSSFRKRATTWIAPEQKGKVIPFGSPQNKVALTETLWSRLEQVVWSQS